MMAPTGSTTIRSSEDGATCHIVLQGEHDIATISRLTMHTDALDGTCSGVVVDLTGATFIDSSLISWLVESRREGMWLAGRTLRVVAGATDSAPSRLFGLLGIDSLNVHLAIDAAARRPLPRW